MSTYGLKQEWMASCGFCGEDFTFSSQLDRLVWLSGHDEAHRDFVSFRVHLVTAEAITDHDFEPGFHEDECTHSSDGTWANYCGEPRSGHVRGENLPTEGNQHCFVPRDDDEKRCRHCGGYPFDLLHWTD